MSEHTPFDRDALETLWKKVLGKGPYWLVLEGDWGGQIYLTVPWDLVGRKAQILPLLKRMNEFAWECNEGEGASYYLTNRAAGAGGGMGGGQLTRGLWLHREFTGDFEMDDPQRQVMVKAMKWADTVVELLDLKARNLRPER